MVRKKSEESGGVMAMMDMMVADIEKEMQTAEVEEKNAQEETKELYKELYIYIYIYMVSYSLCGVSRGFYTVFL